MARIPRKLILEDKCYFHVTWKCHNNDFLLGNDGVKLKLYQLLLRYKSKYGIKIFAYCFMNNHPHILGQCTTVLGFSRFFQTVNSSLAKYVNAQAHRRGQVIMDRLKSPRIQSPEHLVATMHYLDQNPVRAGICKHPKDYRWTSYHHLINSKKDPLIDPLPPDMQIQHSCYKQTSEFLLSKGSLPIACYRNTFFIGSPVWIRQMRVQMMKTYLACKPKSQKAEGTSS